MYNSLVIKVSDTVATVMAPIKQGEQIVYNMDGVEKELTAADNIPIYHKAALIDIAKGEPVIKYGCKIGCATQDIKKGQHVHTHNLDSAAE